MKKHLDYVYVHQIVYFDSKEALVLRVDNLNSILIEISDTKERKIIMFKDLFGEL